MHIIFSPSKEMTLNKPLKEEWNPNKTSKILIKILKEMSDTELKKSLKLSDSKFEEVKTYLNGFNKPTSYKAINLYQGLSFRQLDYNSLDSPSQKFLDDHLLILSALYGPISPQENIKPYRLDFNTSLKNLEGSLKSLWTDQYNSCIEPGELVFNLASDEFSSLFNQEKYQWIDFDFLEKRDNELKSHSTISKKGRGWMVSYIAINKIEDLAKLKEIDDNYYYSQDHSTNNKFVYIKKDK